MLAKEENKKIEIVMDINIGTHQLNEIKKTLEEIKEIEKEYNVNCTQIHLIIQG